MEPPRRFAPPLLTQEGSSALLKVMRISPNQTLSSIRTRYPSRTSRREKMMQPRIKKIAQ